MDVLRPKAVHFSSLAELYALFEKIFLEGNEVSSQIVSDSGLIITVFDHNFFHMVKLVHPNRARFFMKDEKPLLRAQTRASACTHTTDNAQFISWLRGKPWSIQMKSEKPSSEQPPTSS